MEKLCLSSFLKNGHAVHLYSYEEIPDVPKGVISKDAEEIIPKNMFDYRTFINNGTFADYFRYKLLFDRGGWWVDTDLICIQPFCFEGAYVFGYMGPWKRTITHQTRALRRFGNPAPPPKTVVLSGKEICNNCMCAPPGSEIMKAAFEVCCRFDPSKVKWSEDVGPTLLDSLVRHFDLMEFVKSTEFFNPIDHMAIPSMIDPEAHWVFCPDVHAVHLWSDMWNGRTNWKGEETWRITGCAPTIQSKGVAPKGSLYGDLVKRYLGEQECAE